MYLAVRVTDLYMRGVGVCGCGVYVGECVWGCEWVGVYVCFLLEGVYGGVSRHQF